MSSPIKPALFLERASYRQRRLRDFARLLPVIGAILWSIPLLWLGDPDGWALTDAITYTFVVWIVLIALTWVSSRGLRADERTSPTAPSD